MTPTEPEPESAPEPAPRGGPVTGLAVPIAIPPRLAALRDRWDRAALAGAAPHVTVLYPFLPATELGAEVWQGLASVAATMEPFQATFDRVRRWEDGLVWVEPADPGPFQRLTAEVVRRWPAYPPYEGLFDEVIVHLTLVEAAPDAAPFDTVEAAAHAATPFTAPADRLELWRQDEAGRWRPVWHRALGRRGALDPSPDGPPGSTATSG